MTREIKLSGGMVALVDDEDYEMVSAWRWSRSSTDPRLAYATRNFKKDGRWHQVKMHRLILDAPEGVFVDHANGNKLDNRRANIRLCTREDNNRNAARTKAGRYRGAVRSHKRWRMSIAIGGGKSIAKNCDTELEAAVTYDRLARQHHGEFAVLNFAPHRDWIFPHEHKGAWPPEIAERAKAELKRQWGAK